MVPRVFADFMESWPGLSRPSRLQVSAVLISYAYPLRPGSRQETHISVKFYNRLFYLTAKILRSANSISDHLSIQAGRIPK